MLGDWQKLLSFWFGELQDGIADDEHRKMWFASTPEHDTQCSSQFGPLLGPAAAGDLAHWLDTARGRLAFIILCDQMPRNIYRGSADAFAWDQLALAASREGIVMGVDKDLTWDERPFFYMPFEHSEDLIDQHTCVGLFSGLLDEAPDAHKEAMKGTLRFAVHHREIIEQFGRFPHRNQVLKRQNSPAETAFLADHGGFGQ